MKKRHKASGGPTMGMKEWEQDGRDKPTRYNNAPKIEGAAEEKKRGGKVSGMKSMHHAGRKPRATGGRTGSNMNPLSSAHKGTPPSGHKTTDID